MSRDRFWYVPAPAERLAIVRALVGLYAVVYLSVRYPGLTSVTRFAPAQFLPVGPVKLLAAPLSPVLVHGISVATLALGVAFALGLAWRASGPLFALGFLWVTSYRSAWGMIFHTENLTALHLILLAPAPAADAFSLDARRRGCAMEAAPHGRYGWPLRAMCAVTTIAYLLAGVAKLKLAGLHWADGSILRGQIAYDNLRKIELGSLHSPLGAALVRYAAPFRGLASLSLLLELGAPLSLLGTRIARVWVVGVWGFHLGVLALMAIGFPYPLSGIAFLPFFAVERTRAFARVRAKLGATAI
ncbi:MAG: HTTM domain-containing protein [Polyangiales bacterium]